MIVSAFAIIFLSNWNVVKFLKSELNLNVRQAQQIWKTNINNKKKEIWNWKILKRIRT